jgi:hypothetical protein
MDPSHLATILGRFYAASVTLSCRENIGLSRRPIQWRWASDNRTNESQAHLAAQGKCILGCPKIDIVSRELWFRRVHVSPALSLFLLLSCLTKNIKTHIKGQGFHQDWKDGGDKKIGKQNCFPNFIKKNGLPSHFLRSKMWKHASFSLKIASEV